MTKSKSKRETSTDGDAPSRPEDPDTQRLNRAARLLRVDTLPAVAAMVAQADDRRDDSETEAALRRAAKAGDRKKSDA